MPDITSARPASGAPIATAWGAEIHDALEGIQAGAASVSLSAAASGNVTVTFPRPYAVPPVVVASAVTGATYIGAPQNISTTSVQLAVFTRSGSTATATVQLQWIAIGTPA